MMKFRSLVMCSSRVKSIKESAACTWRIEVEFAVRTPRPPKVVADLLRRTRAATIFHKALATRKPTGAPREPTLYCGSIVIGGASGAVVDAFFVS